MFKYIVVLFVFAIFFIAINTTLAQKTVYRRVVRYIPAQTARIVYRPLTPIQKSAKLQTEDSISSEPESEDEEVFLGEASYASEILPEDEEYVSDSFESDSESDDEDSFEASFEGIPLDGVFFPITFGDPEGGSIAISNSFNSGKRGSSSSNSKSFGGSVESTIIN